MNPTTTTTRKPATFTEGHRKFNYDTTRWERLLFESRAGSGAVLDAVQAVAVSELRSGPAGVSQKETTADARDLGTEVFSRLYADPAKLSEAGGPAWTGKAHDVLDALPEFGALREAVANDPDMAALASAECLRTIAEKLPEILRTSDETGDEGQPGQGGAQGSGKPGKGSGQGDADAAAVRSALRKAIARATQRVGDAKEALAGLAPGLESAPATHEQADSGRLALAERLLADPRMRQVLKKAGRIARLARDRRTTRDLNAKEEVVDIERGADLARILPAGLVRLKHPLLRKLALREIVERQAIQYRLEGRETLGRGPIVVLLDRSGSMEGEPELWASATALALVGAGVREKRPVTVVEFTMCVDTVSKVERGQAARLSPRDPAIVENAMTVAQVGIEIASRRSRGGTEFGPVLRYGLRCGALDDRADLVFVTDGLATADDETLAKLTEAKRRGLRVLALTVNGGSLSPSIEAIADASVDLDKADDVGAAIAAVMPS